MDSTLAFIYQLTTSTITVEGETHNLACAWSWVGQGFKNLRFQLANALAYNYIATPGLDILCWNATWLTSDTEEIWKTRWSKIWASDLSYRAKIFIWRVIAKGLFTGAWAILMGHQETHCKVCPKELEMIPHLFETCQHSMLADLGKLWRPSTAVEVTPSNSLLCTPFLRQLT
jgi:hypothetical protein